MCVDDKYEYRDTENCEILPTTYSNKMVFNFLFIVYYFGLIFSFWKLYSTLL